MAGVNVYNYCHGQATQATSGTLGKSLMPQNHPSGVSRNSRCRKASGAVRSSVLQGEAAERNPAMKKQTGYLFHRGQSRHLRYYDTDAKGERIQKCEKLKVAYGGEYRTRRSVQPFIDEILAPLNSGLLNPQATMPVTEFVDTIYLPEYVKKQLRAASLKQYTYVYENHLQNRLGKLTLRSFRTVHGEQMLADI